MSKDKRTGWLAEICVGDTVYYCDRVSSAGRALAWRAIVTKISPLGRITAGTSLGARRFSPGGIGGRARGRAPDAGSAAITAQLLSPDDAAIHARIYAAGDRVRAADPVAMVYHASRIAVGATASAVEQYAAAIEAAADRLTKQSTGRLR